jgi:SAM-dependent methyltransferase
MSGSHKGGKVSSVEYLMENPEEALRLDVKTDPQAVSDQARFFGIGPGARVLDAGCGSGRTTSILHKMIQPGGSIIGVDFARDRIDYAKKHYQTDESIQFQVRDIREGMDDIGKFDFIWVRFVLEYYLEGSADIIRNLANSLNPEGSLCLLDLDNNCLGQFPLKPDMESILQNLVQRMIRKYNFDPFVGRKLYTILYDLGFREIRADLIPHHLIYGELKGSDDFNWIKKVEMASIKAGDLFEAYPGKYEGFFSDFKAFFRDPRRFTYTPLIMCTGKKPVNDL